MPLPKSESNFAVFEYATGQYLLILHKNGHKLLLILIVENRFDGVLVDVRDDICFSFADEGDQIGVVGELVFSLSQFALDVLEHCQ